MEDPIEHKSGIYMIISPTARVYIGQAIDLFARVKTYRKCGCEGQPRIYASIKKYGWEAHYFSVIEYCSTEELNAKERYWQLEYDVLKMYGLNCKIQPVDGTSGKLSDEIRKKISDANKGKPKSEEAKRKYHLCKLGNKYNAGVKHRKKIVSHRKGKKLKPQSPETIQKRVEATKITMAEKYPDGYKASPETRLKMSESRKSFEARKRLKEITQSALDF